MEQWKSIQGSNSKFEYKDQTPISNSYSRYEISTKGEVRNIQTHRIYSQHIRSGYNAISLCNLDTKKNNTVNTHRIVASTFIPNPNFQKYVNHIDGNKLNCSVENLEWCSSAGNAQHAIKTGLTKVYQSCVEQYALNGAYIQSFNSILYASRVTGANDRHISDVCKGKRKTCGGYIWKYKHSEQVVEEDNVVGKEILEFPNYLITPDHRVYSKRSKKYLKQHKMYNGLCKIKLCNDGIMKDVYVHKLVREYYPETNEPISPKS